MDLGRGKYGDSSLDKWDKDFNQMSGIIQPFIKNITNNQHLAQYRLWMKKLSDGSNEDKFVRNQYMIELANQIENKQLNSPFTKAPPEGNLPPIKSQPWTPKFEEYFGHLQEDQSEESDSYVSSEMMFPQCSEDITYQWPYHKTSTRPRRSITSQQIRAAKRCVQRGAIEVKKMNLLKEIKNQCDDKYSEGSDSGTATPRSPSRPQRHSFTRTPSTPRTALLTTPTSPPAPSDARIDFELKNRLHQASLGVIPEDKSDAREAASWDNMTDVSEASLAIMGSGDTEKMHERGPASPKVDDFESKFNSLVLEINGLKRKSEKVNERCEHTIRTVQEQIPSKNSLSSPEDIKEAADQIGGGFLATDWKKIVASLEVRLSETQHQNKELNALTSTLHKKIKEMDATKEQVKQEIRKQIQEQHKKEIESLKSEHQKNVQEMQSAHDTKIGEMEKTIEKKILAESAKFESKLNECKEKYDKELKEKDAEIHRLEDIIQKECMRLLNEIKVLRTQIEEASSTNSNNNEQILFLHRCITQMDRLFQKSEREYCIEIEKLKQDLDNRNKATQIQLQTQKAEVITRCSAEKQSEVDAIVRSLGDKYTTLLEMQQVQISRIRNEDEKIISELRSILDQHNISYPY